MNIIFDIGNVLVKWDPVDIVRSVINAPGAVRVAEHLFDHADWHEVDRGCLTIPEIIQRAVERTDIDEDIVTAIYQAVPASLTPIAENIDLLLQLKRAGHGIYALSNMGLDNAAYLAKTAPFWNEFDGRVISAEVKLIKPDPAIYEYLLEKNGLTNSGCIFIDDSLINVHTAENLGIKSIHFQSSAQVATELRKYISWA
ncbi:HAD-superfamily hydrolase, subfamily IA, variant 3 [Tolumonas auensis DSM 9187]|jgi:putative hydrolase of the HAD superfamily|uniref:HAD-superfamily hydrolase, subfamily IA, variant 3 n=1 Tax=Tolumonas auensis (strain DSM 9187 / NBRC 110442 / TA 4) TaxID=595494 RepID=C4LEG5_TOLAT|nr:HAD family phosphatase [Tolumonas auensis]ACQ92982.1 HAD-superfamily hydrolase, subfamily IA, variant 3 [Tolumonas auensis DSM 9187]